MADLASELTHVDLSRAVANVDDVSLELSLTGSTPHTCDAGSGLELHLNERDAKSVAAGFSDGQVRKHNVALELIRFGG